MKRAFYMIATIAITCFVISAVSATNSQKTVQDIPPELKDQIPPELRDRAIILDNNSFGISGPLSEDELHLLDEYQRSADEKNRKGFFERTKEEISIYFEGLVDIAYNIRLL